MSATEKVDEVFDYTDGNGNIYMDQIKFEDTLGFKAKLTFPLLGAQTYLSAHHAGLVADGGQHHKQFGVTDPSRLPYSGLGNKGEYEAGMMMNFGNFMVFPRVMYRDNLVDANPFIPPSIGPGGVLNPGLSPRDVTTIRLPCWAIGRARSAEVFFTYDPTGATQFYAWDNDWREDAKFAIDFGGGYTEFPTATDANLFFLEPPGVNASFGEGLPAEDVWTASSRMVFNPKPGQKYITRFVRGFDQSTGNPTGGTRDYFEFHCKAILGRDIVVGLLHEGRLGSVRLLSPVQPYVPGTVHARLLDPSGRQHRELRRCEERRSRNPSWAQGIYRATDETRPTMNSWKAPTTTCSWYCSTSLTSFNGWTLLAEVIK